MSAHSSRPFLNYFCVYKQDWSWDYECKSMHTIYFQKWFYADSCTKFTTSSDLVQQDLQRCKQLKQKRLGVWTWQWKLNSKWDTVSKREQSLFLSTHLRAPTGLSSLQHWGSLQMSPAVSRHNPLTSSEALAWRPDAGDGLGTSDQNCSCNCSGGFGVLCSQLRPPIAEAGRASRERWSWRCGGDLPLNRCCASLSFYTWSAYSETIFSPERQKKRQKN